MAKKAKKRLKIDTKNLREELLTDLKRMFELAKQAATKEGISEKQAQHWIRIMGYIGQVMNSLAKNFDETKALEQLEKLERMIRGTEENPERSQTT
jgi:alpha-D-ribose 1-methylphosphonate 5-triphosphate synthase subunit PhnH